MNKQIEFSVVIPVFNTGATLLELSDRLDRVFKHSLQAEYEIIFVDDASTNPQTWITLEQVSRTYPQVRILQLTRNFGQQAATICGLRASMGKFVITMDDDSQHHPEDIPKLAQALKDADIVIAQFPKKRHSLRKKLPSAMKGWIAWKVIGKPRGIQLSPFRLLSRPVVDAMLKIQTPFPFIPALMLSVSSRVVGVEVEHGARKEGKGGYNLSKELSLMGNLLINNSSVLLRLIGWLGLSISALSFVLGFVFLVRKVLDGHTLAGWTSLMVSIQFLSGLLLFSMGIVGEYLIRIIRVSEGKPTYVIRRNMQGGINASRNYQQAEEQLPNF